MTDVDWEEDAADDASLDEDEDEDELEPDDDEDEE